jgi:hypothetical protein
MIQGRIRHLEQLHQDVDNKIDAMEKTGVFSDNDLNTLKKKRLEYRDELSRLRRQLYEENQRVEFEDDR